MGDPLDTLFFHLLLTITASLSRGISTLPWVAAATLILKDSEFLSDGRKKKSIRLLIPSIDRRGDLLHRQRFNLANISIYNPILISFVNSFAINLQTLQWNTIKQRFHIEI